MRELGSYTDTEIYEFNSAFGTEKFEELITKLRRFFYFRAYQSTNDDLDDLVQETMLRVWNAICHGTAINDIDAYVFGIARNLAHETLRAKYRPFSSIDEITEMKSMAASIEDQLIERERFRIRYIAVTECLDKLGVGDRALLEKYFKPDVSSTRMEYRKLIAEQLGITPTTLRVKIHRLVMNLKSCLNEQEKR